MEKLCSYCEQEECPLISNVDESELCIFNLIIYQDNDKTLFYNLSEKRIFVIKKGYGLMELNFQEAIRAIDTIPEKTPKWKKLQILQIAKDLGFFGID